MIAKLVYSALFVTEAVSSRQKYRPTIEEYLTRHENRPDNVFTQMKEDMRAHKARHPFVQQTSGGDTYNQSCTWATERMGNGPTDWTDRTYTSANPYVDTDFNGISSIYWSDYSTSTSAYTYNSLIDQGYSFPSWSRTFPSSAIWTAGSVDFNDIAQGSIGTCYILASMSALGEWEEKIKDIFLGLNRQSSGIIPIKFYIRGKPWVLTVDEQLFTSKSGNLFFAGKSPNDNSMWGALIEKAYAKMNGNYEFVNGGFVENGLRTFVGAPVFTYDGYYATTQAQAETTHALLVAADAANYVMGAAVYSSDIGGDTNSCGIYVGHAYAIISAFTITEADGTKTKVIMGRNPWGITFYNKEWSSTDAKWTDDIVTNQVPNGVDPRTSNKVGIFVMPIKYYINGQCISSVQVGHVREKDGYKYTWYDEEQLNLTNADNTTQQYFSYTVTVPRVDGDIYFSAETFQQVHVPLSCFDSSLSYYGYPVLYIDITNQRTNEYWYQYYAEAWNRPVLVSSDKYAAGDTFSIFIMYDFDGAPNRDFTVQMYSKMSEDTNVWIKDVNGYANQLHMDGTEPSGFYNSTYRNGQEKPLPNTSVRDQRNGAKEEEERKKKEEEDRIRYEEERQAREEAAEERRRREIDPFHQDYVFQKNMTISSLRDVFIYSRNNQEFDELFWANPWVVGYWFNETASETAEYDNTPKEESSFFKDMGIDL